MIRSVTNDTFAADGDVLNFGGWTKDGLIALLHVAALCKGDGNSFVVDEYITVLVDDTGLVVVIGAMRR